MTKFTPGKEMDEAVGKAVGLSNGFIYGVSVNNGYAITAIELLLEKELADNVDITFRLDAVKLDKWISEVYSWSGIIPLRKFRGMGYTPAEAICHSILRYAGVEEDE